MSPDDAEDQLRRTRARRVLIGTVAVVVLIGAVGLGVALSTDDSDPGSGATGNPTAGEATVTKLGFGPAITAKCAAPSVKNVAGQSIAFKGTVLASAHRLVTLEVVEFYKGTATDLVTVDKPDLQMTELPVDFEVGKTYLVGATADGEVSICGLSGLATAELTALYAKAFAN